MNWSVIGHKRIKTYFTKALKEGFSSHAYVLTGAEGIGKRSLILDVIRAAHAGTEPGVNDPYAFIVGPDEKSTISIKDHIKPLKRALTLRPPQGVRTFVLIDDADRLSFDASHAVLNMLEEPPADAVFFLVTAAAGELALTIRSRCLQIRCTPPAHTDVEQFLASKNVASQHHTALSALAGGGIGWLTDIIEKKQAAKVIAAYKTLEVTLKKGKAERLAWAKTYADSDDIRQLALRWLNATRVQVTTDPSLARRADGLLELHGTLGHTGINKRLALEHFVLSA